MKIKTIFKHPDERAPLTASPVKVIHCESVNPYDTRNTAIQYNSITKRAASLHMTVNEYRECCKANNN